MTSGETIAKLLTGLEITGKKRHGRIYESNTMNLIVQQSISLPSRAGHTNDDACGAAPGCAFVIDGATGLGDNILPEEHGSDAAWLASFCKRQFEDMTRPGRPLPDIVREACRQAARVIEAASKDTAVEPWQLPVAGFSMLRVEDGEAMIHGLGDCVLLAVDDTGAIFQHCPMDNQAETERAYAARTIAEAGGLSKTGSLNNDAATLELLQAARAAYNRDGGKIWTLGTNPDTADHIDSQQVALREPFTGLLMSDGFAALWQSYGRYDAAGLVEAARTRGLDVLIDELRHIETVEDPDGFTHPRFKVSDDATAVLCRVE